MVPFGVVALPLIWCECGRARVAGFAEFGRRKWWGFQPIISFCGFVHLNRDRWLYPRERLLGLLLI